MSDAARYAVVIPTVGRPSLAVLIERLAAGRGPRPELVVVVDDRPKPGAVPVLDPRKVASILADRVVVARSGGRGPAAARNAGWALVPPDVRWIAFLDDDVDPSPDWPQHLVTDLAAADDASTAQPIAGTQARITVPLPNDRRPTDWERGTAGLCSAWWITADMAYRRDVLAAVGGFDERFGRAFREDSDLALRVQDAGYRLVVGDRVTTHPVRPAAWYASVRQQSGNADDALLRRRYGRRWRDRVHDDGGRTGLHLATVIAEAGAVLGVLTRQRRLAIGAATVWIWLTARFTIVRVAAGPRDAAEVTRMTVTSALIPAAAVWHRSRGWLRRTRPEPSDEPLPLQAVLFDRDGTLIEDVPYNGDPNAVAPLAAARAGVDLVRSAGLLSGVVTNQSGVARGRIGIEEVYAINDRVDDLFGPFDAWSVCPHAPDSGCACRKPAPGGVQRAAAALGVPPSAVALVGDIGSDVEAAAAAGAVAVLVPTAATRDEEVAAAPVVCSDLITAARVLTGRST